MLWRNESHGVARPSDPHAAWLQVADDSTTLCIATHFFFCCSTIRDGRESPLELISACEAQSRLGRFDHPLLLLLLLNALFRASSRPPPLPLALTLNLNLASRLASLARREHPQPSLFTPLPPSSLRPAESESHISPRRLLKPHRFSSLALLAPVFPQKVLGNMGVLAAHRSSSRGLARAAIASQRWMSSSASASRVATASTAAAAAAAAPAQATKPRAAAATAATVRPYSSAAARENAYDRETITRLLYSLASRKEKLVTTRNGVLNGVNDNIWKQIRKDHKRLVWTSRADDDQRAWHYERADGSFTRNGRSLFYYGIHDVAEVEQIVRGLEEKSRIERAYLPLKPAKPTGTRGYSTMARPGLTSARVMGEGRRGYATAVERSGPLPASTTDKKRVALIGARGYTGQSLIALLNNHPHIELSHVSSRELAGMPLAGYSKADVKYTNIGVEDLKKLERGEGPGAPPDAYVMALPNGVCKPFVEAVQAGGKDKPNGHGVIVDLSADYRFDEQWTYGLPEIYGRKSVRGSKLVSNPGCYATNNQALIAPLLSVLDLARGPTVFGVSGYSGAGTKASETPTGERKTVPKITPEDLAGGIRAYALTDHIHEREAGYQLSKLGESEDQVPEIKDVALQHGVKIGGFQVNARGDRVVVVAAIDNLLKGAATQCLQNLNIALGYDEYAGIPPLKTSFVLRSHEREPRGRAKFAPKRRGQGREKAYIQGRKSGECGSERPRLPKDTIIKEKNGAQKRYCPRRAEAEGRGRRASREFQLSKSGTMRGELKVRWRPAKDRQKKRPKADTEAQVVSLEWRSMAAGAQWTPGYRMGGERIQESSNKRSVKNKQTARAGGAVQGSTVRHGVAGRRVKLFTCDAGDTAHRGVHAGVLVEVVVAAEALVARRVGAQEGLLVRVDGADVPLEVLAALEALAAARHLARVDLAALAEVVHLLGLVGHTASTRALGDEAGVRVGEMGKVAVQAHALGQHRQTGSLGRDVLNLDLTRGGRGEHRGHAGGHAEARIGRRAASAVGRRRARGTVRVGARSVRGALGEDHGVGAAVAEERVDRVRAHGHGHGSDVGAVEEAKAGLATAGAEVAVAAVARHVGKGQWRDGHVLGPDGARVGGVVAVSAGGRLLDEVVEAEVGRVRDVDRAEGRVVPRGAARVVGGGGRDVAVIGLAVAAAVVELGGGGGGRAGDRGCEGEALDGARSSRRVGEECGALESKVVPELKVGFEGSGREGQVAGHVDGGGEADGPVGREGQVEELRGGSGAEELVLHVERRRKIRDGEDSGRTMRMRRELRWWSEEGRRELRGVERRREAKKWERREVVKKVVKELSSRVGGRATGRYKVVTREAMHVKAGMQWRRGWSLCGVEDSGELGGIGGWEDDGWFKFAA
ncbi:hypothetical protein L1887_53008 [Cichorium endivia]|nr:hypothetical protein L1887_53008 [Cichorium endivia]